MSAKDRERLYRYANGVGDAPVANDQLEPVGTVEVADRLGVTRAAVDKWRERATDFPDPRWTVGGRPAWNWHEIERWAKSTGRLT